MSTRSLRFRRAEEDMGLLDGMGTESPYEAGGATFLVLSGLCLGICQTLLCTLWDCAGGRCIGFTAFGFPETCGPRPTGGCWVAFPGEHFLDFCLCDKGIYPSRILLVYPFNSIINPIFRLIVILMAPKLAIRVQFYIRLRCHEPMSFVQGVSAAHDLKLGSKPDLRCFQGPPDKFNSH